jgi:hypothetical protein
MIAAGIWSQTSPAFAVSAPAGALWYTVVAGDDVVSIAAKLNQPDWVAFANQNGIYSPYTIYVGEVLKYIPQGGSGTQTGRPQGPLVPTSGVLFGAYDSSGITHFEGQLGRKVALDQHFYSGLTSVGSDLTNSINNALANGRIPVITWDMGGTTPLLASIIAGKYDAGIKAHANAFKQSGKKVFLRWGAEMNGNWIPTIDGSHNGGSTSGPANFIKAWKHIHDLFVAQGATNVVWVWSPNSGSVPQQTWNNWKNYYPGDTYVDWVGMDGYNRDPSPWILAYDIYKDVYNDYKSLKPIMIGETGTVEEGDGGTMKASWFTNSASTLQNSMPSVAGYVYFNSNTSTHAWRIDTTTKSLAGFKTAFGQNSYYSVTVKP